MNEHELSACWGAQAASLLVSATSRNSLSNSMDQELHRSRRASYDLDHVVGAAVFYLPAPSAVAFDRFRFHPYTTAAFDVFPGLKIPDNGLFQIFLEPAPNGSDHVEVWLVCVFAQTGVPQFMVANVLRTNWGESKPKSQARNAEVSQTNAYQHVN